MSIVPEATLLPPPRVAESRCAVVLKNSRITSDPPTSRSIALSLLAGILGLATLIFCSPDLWLDTALCRFASLATFSIGQRIDLSHPGC